MLWLLWFGNVYGDVDARRSTKTRWKHWFGRCGISVFVGVEEEKFVGGPHVEAVAKLVGMTDGLLQDEAGIAGEPASVGAVDVADETGDLALLGTPGEGDEGVDIRI